MDPVTLTSQGALTVVVTVITTLIPLLFLWTAVKQTRPHPMACPRCDEDVPVGVRKCPGCGSFVPDTDQML